MHLVTASAMDDSATSVCSGVKHVASQISYNHRTASRGREELRCERARSPERKRGGCYLAGGGPPWLQLSAQPIYFSSRFLYESPKELRSVMRGRSEATVPGTEDGEGAGGPPAGCCSQRDRLSSRLAIHNSISRVRTFP